MNLYLKKKLRLSEDRPAKQKVHVVEIWDRYFQQVQTAHVRDYLQIKGFLGPQANLKLEDVHEYLAKTLKLDDKHPAKTMDEVVEVWAKYFEQLTCLS